MSRQIPTIQATNPGSSNNFLNDTLKSDEVSRSELNEFLDAASDAVMSHDGKGIPYLETSKKIIQHYNRGHAMKGFEETGYFIFHGVKVIEKGTLAKVSHKESLSMEELLHGAK